MELEWVPREGMLVQTPMGVGVIVGYATPQWDGAGLLPPLHADLEPDQWPWDVLVGSSRHAFHPIQLERV